MFNYRINKKSYHFLDYFIHGVFFFFYGLIKYFPSPIGDFFRYLISKPFFSSLGRVRICEGVTIWFPSKIRIGNNVTLNEWVYVSGYGGIEIGDNVRIGHRTSILSSNHSYEDIEIPICMQKITAKPVQIENDVWIGCNVTILAGVKIGQGSVIGAGSVVTKNIPPYSIAAGVPSRIIKKRMPKACMDDIKLGQKFLNNMS